MALSVPHVVRNKSQHESRVGRINCIYPEVIQPEILMFLYLNATIRTFHVGTSILMDLSLLFDHIGISLSRKRL